jgi:monofunctional glycosyltransferase
VKTAKTFLLAALCSLLVLGGFTVLELITLRFISPPSTAFERAEFIRLARQIPERGFSWAHQPIAYERMGDAIKSAVIASEDSAFVDHGGAEWDAIQRAWESNNKGKRIKGGSTISQQLAKNLFLSGERKLARKGVELGLTYALEATLSKARLLELYLNHVEWGEGIFGIHAAAAYYFKTEPEKLTQIQAAKLAVMLPQPRFYSRRKSTPYLESRARVIVRRMALVDLPEE